MTTRRSFLLSMLALGAAPAIVQVESLMKLWVPRQKLLIGRYEAFNFYESAVLPDELTYYAIINLSMEQTVREHMRTGTGFVKVLYRGEVARHG